MLTRLLPLLATAAILGAQEPKPAANAAPEATATLEGRVVDLRGEPVPMASVSVTTWQEPDKPLARGMCDGDGYFRLGRVPVRDLWIVQADSPGHCRGKDYVRGSARSATIEVHDATKVRGILRNGKGKPVAGTVVHAELESRVLSYQELDARTDQDGRFVLEAVPLGWMRFSAALPGEGIASLRLVVAGECEIVLAPGQEPTTDLKIVIAGLPADAATAATASLDCFANGSRIALPPPWNKPGFDAAGKCEMLGVPDIAYTVTPAAKGFDFTPRQQQVAPGKGPHALQFSATAKLSELLDCKALLCDGQGQPLAGIKLVLRMSNSMVGTEATTAADGSVTFRTPLTKDAQAIVQSRDKRWALDQEKTAALYGSRDRRFAVYHEFSLDPAVTLALRAVPACSVQGRLLLTDGRAAAFVEVHLQEETNNRMPGWMTFSYATTDRDGNYTFAGLHPLAERVRVLVESRSGAATSEPLAMSEPGAQLAVPELKLSPPATIEGVVLDAEQRPAPGIRVWLRDWEFTTNQQKSGSVVEVISDRLGRYRFVGVPPGGAWLQLVVDEEHPRGRAVEPFEVEAGKNYTLELQVEKKGT